VTKPSHSVVKRQGWSFIFCTYIVRVFLRSENNFFLSGWLHSNRCLASSGSHWQDGHSLEPWCGWALDARSGSFSWINRISHLWSSDWNEDNAELTVVQSTLSKLCAVQLFFFVMSFRYGGTEAACLRAVRTFRQIILFPIIRCGCAIGILGFPHTILDCCTDVVYCFALPLHSTLSCSSQVSGLFGSLS